MKRRVVLATGMAAVFIVIAVFSYFFPFRTLLPAYKILARQEGELRLHFLDVGQGDCTLVEFPSGEVLVIDAGDGSFKTENKLIRYIKGLAPKSLSMLLTHANSDHLGGFKSLLEVFGTEIFYLPALSADTAEYSALLAAIEESGCKKATLSRYDTIVREGAYLVCLSPYSFGETDENDSSTVLYLDCGGVNAVFCGDISSARERLLTREYALDETLFDSGDCSVRLDGVEILKVSHHGSEYSSSEEWLGLLRPETSIISCGRGNDYSHPAEGALARIKAASPNGEIYRTDELGDVMVTIKDGKYTVSAVWE